MARVVESSSPAGFRADLVAQPETAKTIRTIPNPKLFSFRTGLDEIGVDLGAFPLATPPMVLQTVLSKSSRYSLGRLGKRYEQVQRLSAVAASGSASAGRSVSMSMTGG